MPMTSTNTNGGNGLFLFVRAMPINITPAVGRYLAYLQTHGRRGPTEGAELRFKNTGARDSLPLDRLHTMEAPYGTEWERVKGLVAWQFFLSRLIWRTRPATIQFCDVFSAIPAMLGKLFFGSRLVYDIRDNIGLSVQHRSPLIARGVQAIEDLAARYSDGVVTVSAPLRSVLPTRAQTHAYVIPNAPLKDAFEAFHFSEGSQLRINIAGFVSFRRNLAAWCEVREKFPALDLDLYGNVADEATQKILVSHGIQGVATCSHAEALGRMASADAVSLMYDPAIAINAFAAPNKYYEALMLGKPIICAKGMRMAEELLERDCGLEVPYGDASALQVALEILAAPERRRSMGRNARQLFLERYLGAADRAMAALYARLGLVPGS
jgi:glycosyltransferase involved in cell wall biosynthesis